MDKYDTLLVKNIELPYQALLLYVDHTGFKIQK